VCLLYRARAGGSRGVGANGSSLPTHQAAAQVRAMDANRTGTSRTADCSSKHDDSSIVSTICSIPPFYR